MSRARRIARIVCSLAGALLLAAFLLVMTVSSPWFYGKVRNWIANTLETATGGRVEIGSFAFDWRHLRAQVTDLTLHGLEPAGKPPLLHCAKAEVGLKIISIFERDIDIQYLQVTEPQIYLIVGPDGQTNIPRPKIPPRGSGNAIESILKLAIGRVDIVRGEFSIETHGKTPFELHGHNLAADLNYERAVPQYRGTISVQPLDLAGRGAATVTASIRLQANRIGIDQASIATGDSRVTLSGTIEDLASPHGTFRYNALIANADAARFLRTRLLQRGTAQSSGTLTWGGGSDFSLSGSVHAYGLEYRDSQVRLQNFQADGSLNARALGIDLHGLRFSGRVAASGLNLPVRGTVAETALRGRDLTARGIVLSVLDGVFRGNGSLRRLEHYIVQGEIAGFDSRRIVSLYSKEALPWDALVDGPVELEGTLGRPKDFRAHAALIVAPAPGSAPVHGTIEATYEARNGTLDLGRSTLVLPSSTLTASGAIGALHVHLETHDLNDLLPVLGSNTSTLPVTLESSAEFDGTVAGNLSDPHVTGTLRSGRFRFEGREFQSLHTNVTASSINLSFANGTLARDAWHAQFQGALALNDWRPENDSQIFGSAGIQNAPLSDLATLSGVSIPLGGMLNATAELKGTVANPLVEGQIAVRDGTLPLGNGEPFQSFTARLSYANNALHLAGGQLVSGPKQVQVTATYSHQPNDFSKGRVEFQVTTNVIPLDQIRTVREERPGAKGTVQMTAHGVVDVPFRLESLSADVVARGLQLADQTLGDLHLTAQSQGLVLNAHLESDFAASSIKGDGQWRLEGDYPGTANITFSKVDFGQLRAWLLPAASGVASDLTGYTAGSLHVEGPATKPDQIRAELRLPEFQVGISTAGLALRNSSPIVIDVANGAATIRSARLSGRNTDLAVTGKIAFQPKPQLDAHVIGRIDLAIVHDWNRDFTASGVLDADATIRGPLNAPQVAGRVAFDRAAFNISDVPNGISNATGTIVFTGDRASIQKFTGETGGGKIELSGFIAYGGGPTIFRLHARIDQVRVRYPEGVSTVANASLNLTGSTDRSMLAGTITVLRASFNPQADFSSVIARSAEPARTPSVRTGFLGGLNFDINIETSPDIQVESSLTQDIQMEANLHLRGTVSSPALLGRVNITQGQVVFFGTKYRIGQGTISFYNPLTVEPVLDVSLETKARGIEVTLTISGPLNKLKLSTRSDPPLQFGEIVALLTTGRTPTSDSALMSSQNPAAQSFQQMGASALLGQAISSPVTGRLQRFFGVSKLRIDPTLPGVEYNPQARLTLEQQVTPNITFTYITDVTSTNPQVVSVEWAFAREWAAVAQRDENGFIGMDIFFKKRF